MKIVFLDIDGVLNNKRWIAAQKNFKRFCPDNVKMLNHIFYKTGAQIVISSNWRLYPYDLPALFKAQSIDAPIVSYTPILGIERGYEINSWLSTQAPEAIDEFVIIDDDDDMAMHLPRLIRTDPEFGLTLDNAKAAIKMLGEKPPLTEEEAIRIMTPPKRTPLGYA